MGLTPLEGIIMGTRSGSIDPAICDFICQKENITPAEMNTILNKKSGVLGISNVSSDFRDIEAADGWFRENHNDAPYTFHNKHTEVHTNKPFRA